MKIIKITLFFFLMSSMLPGYCSQSQNSSWASSIKNSLASFYTSLKANPGMHIKNGAKDVALAYAIAMGITAIHELGHAIMGKIFYGSPIDVTLGAQSSNQKIYAQLGGIKLGGFNPATGYSHPFNTDLPIHNYPLKNATITLAGPVCGALSSIAAYLLLRKYDGLYATKAVSLYGLFNHTLGVAGVAGIILPGSDGALTAGFLKEYYNQKQSD